MSATKKSDRPALSGLLLADKPGGRTSFDAVRAVRRAFGQRDVGHAGTLDPMATGLLVIALGKATRLLTFVEAEEKVYRGTVTLGRATATFDAEGATTGEAPVPSLPREEIEGALRSLTGKVMQQVPAFSAVKVDGERLYSKARRGEAFEPPSREIEVHALIATRIALPEIDIEARVSKGTYIRTLAVQIGAALGLPAHLSALRRTAIGRFGIEQAHALDALRGEPDELLPIEAAVAQLQAFEVGEAGQKDVSHGRALLPDRVLRGPSRPLFPGEAARVIGPNGALLAVVRAKPEGGLSYACVLSSSEA